MVFRSVFSHPVPAPSGRRRARNLAAAGLTFVAGAAMVLGTSAAPALANPGHHPGHGGHAPATYSIDITGTGDFAHPTDSPASPFIAADGTFYYQQSASLYGANDPHYWHFFTGTDLDTAGPDQALNTASDPDNPQDANNDTVWRCNNGPTGKEATASASYPEKDYCDLIGTWVDPDTGDWYGLVHNEFTGSPFGDGLHYDAIDMAVSTTQGKTWKIVSHAITSPYSTTRGDTKAFPEETYDYGDGDPRLYVDTASGYFYVYYGSRIVNKSGGWVAFYSHVARAPMKDKMAAGSWQKYYAGHWSQPGIGGKESNLVPVTADNPTGYTPPSKEYKPTTPGTAQQQIAKGQMPATSPLFVMNISYDAYLGEYIGTPQAVDQSGKAPQQVYATKSLAHPAWRLIGDTGSYHTASWYRWFLDPANKTGNTVLGKSLRMYCSIACANGAGGQYIDVDLTSNRPAAAPVDLTRSYRITSGEGKVLTEARGGTVEAQRASRPGHGHGHGRGHTSAAQSWYFVSNNDGSYSILNTASHRALGVDSSSTAGRAWGARPTVSAEAPSGPTVGQEWWIVRETSSDGHAHGGFRLVNRYSGLELSMPSHARASVVTAPTRSWTDRSHDTDAADRTAAQQTMSLSSTGRAPRVVSVSNPGDQSWLQGTAVSLDTDASSPEHGRLSYSATGLPAGLTIDSSTGTITGTPSQAGSGDATIRVRLGHTTGSTEFHWSVEANLTGDHTVQTPGGHALEDPNGTSTAGVQLTVGSGSGDAQTWTFQRQGDGSYALVNKKSGQ